MKLWVKEQIDKLEKKIDELETELIANNEENSMLADENEKMATLLLNLEVMGVINLEDLGFEWLYVEENYSKETKQ